jgi:aspartokinase
MLIAAGAVAFVAAITGIWLEQRSLSAASGLDAARQRSAAVETLASRYTELTSRAIEVSASVDEARSAGYLSAALKKHGIAGASIDAGNPEPATDEYDKTETSVNFTNAGLASIIELLRDVEEGKRNLALTGATLRREGAADSWIVTLEYAGLVRK